MGAGPGHTRTSSVSIPSVGCRIMFEHSAWNVGFPCPQCSSVFVCVHVFLHDTYIVDFIIHVDF